MASKVNISGIVLAGGMSRRLGRNKALEPIGGEPLITRVIGRLSRVTDEIVVNVNDAERAAVLPLPKTTKVAVDIYPDSGSLGGIYTGLSAASGDWGIVVACDMPFLNLELFRRMVGLREGYDAVVPVLDGRPEPTHAVYSKRCLHFIEAKLKSNDLKIAKFFDGVRVRYVAQSEVEQIDPERLSFFNVNTQEDLDRAVALAAAGK
ncbi:MAG: molybdenum cofactor guanylyltransferase [SAR202 cluster bacterium]|nr:molybdenum cofactor guanylyltransferase [SAR202 cluster bacterium]